MCPIEERRYRAAGLYWPDELSIMVRRRAAVTEAELKARLLELLKTDEEFRYAVLGLLGIDEVIKAIHALQEQVAENTRAIWSLQNQVRDLQEQVAKHSEVLTKHSEAIEELSKRIEELARSIQALGARWGLLAEESFRAGMTGVVERYFGGRVRRWAHYDEEGFVFGFPSVVEVDMVISDKEHILVEIKSSVSRADVYELWKVGQLYERIRGVKPRLAIVSPFVREEAKELAKELGIDVYTSLSP